MSLLDLNCLKKVVVEDAGYLAPLEDGSGVEVIVAEDSERLELLTPFVPIWESNNRRKITHQSPWKMYNRSYFYGWTLVTLQRSFG